jgi:hypothetical protein
MADNQALPLARYSVLDLTRALTGETWASTKASSVETWRLQ